MVNHKPTFIKEGNTQILVYKKKQSNKGPGSKANIPFYNPSMEKNRDFSILIAQWMNKCQKRHLSFIDGLAASGIRGIRIANEVHGDFTVTINDWDKKSYLLIKKNIKKINNGRIISSNKNLNTILSEKKYDYIDIDPFGSPIYFIDSAFRSIKNNGIIACTATDTAPLCGVYAKVCLRRYNARPFHSPIMHEIGLRILLGCIAKNAARYDKTISPIASIYSDHYFRVYFSIKESKKMTNENLKKIYAIKPEDYFSSFKKPRKNIGPLWMGKIQDKKINKKLLEILSNKNIGTKKELWRLLETLIEEADMPPFYHISDEMASNLKVSTPSLKTIFSKLRSQGFKVSRTHFCNNGIKTNASEEDIKQIFFE
ncbi:MAG: tRNA (guanine(10)-N(2))-dimethyltransferase [Candidatus Thermoplasmatota archaeon]